MKRKLTIYTMATVSNMLPGPGELIVTQVIIIADDQGGEGISAPIRDEE